MAHPVTRPPDYRSYSSGQGPPRASAYIDYHGKRNFRRTGFLTPGGNPTCPGNHRVDFKSKLLEDGILYCDAQAAKGQARCGALIFVLTFPSRGTDKEFDCPVHTFRDGERCCERGIPRSKRRLWLADCTREEVAVIERAGWDADGIVDYFGGSFPR